MSLTIRGRPIRFSLKWLKPPPAPPDGAMTLFEHLRELRYRLVVASLAILARFRTELVSDDELEKAKRRYRSDLQASYDDLDGL